MITRYFDKIFIINLARRQDRWKECVTELEWNSIPLSAVERFEAFDNPENGHAGCTRSHRMLLRRIAASDWNRVLVLEDDFQVLTLTLLRQYGFTFNSKVYQTFCTIRYGRGDLNERFGDLLPFAPNLWDVLYLGASYGEPPISRLNPHVIRCGFMQTTGSYGITREFARIWTDKVDASMGSDDLDRHPGPIDNVFGSMAHDHLYYVFQPRLICQRVSRSDLDGETNSRILSNTDPNHENMV